MSNTASKEDLILINMSTWKRRHFSHYKNGFVDMLGCGDKRIKCVPIQPGDGQYNAYGFVIVGPYNTELGSIFWDEDGYNTGFRVNEVGCKRVKKSLDKINDKIEKEMNEYLENDLEYMKGHLAKMCGCDKDEIYIEKIVPGLNFNNNCCIIFRGPQIEGKDNYLGDVQWDMNGKFYDFEPDQKNIGAIRRYYKLRDEAIMERARNKSVNRTVEQKQEREISLGKEFAKFISSHVKEIAIAAAIFIACSSTVNFFKGELNPDYVNPSYRAGYEAVSVETHRTQDNQHYWYDYGDIAARYDESYDFDSWVYGAYKNVGWNTESKHDCMDEIFDRLEDRGITDYDSFLEYCEAKGVCVEKDGKLVIDTKEFKELTEDYMRNLNSGALAQVEEAEGKSRFRI